MYITVVYKIQQLFYIKQLCKRSKVLIAIIVIISKLHDAESTIRYAHLASSRYYSFYVVALPQKFVHPNLVHLTDTIHASLILAESAELGGDIVKW